MFDINGERVLDEETYRFVLVRPPVEVYTRQTSLYLDLQEINNNNSFLKSKLESCERNSSLR